jgi:hypothetical protein
VTLEELIARVRAKVIEEGDCWVWQGAVSGVQRELPQMTVRENGRRTNRSVRRMLKEKAAGYVRHDRLVTTSCRTFGCVNPDHLVEITVGGRNRRAAKDGHYADPVRRAKIAAKARARLSDLTPDVVAKIREAGSASEAARLYGVTKSNAVKIRAHETWREYTSPFAGLMG